LVDTMDYSFANLIDLEQTRELLQHFAESVGVSAAIVDREGTFMITSSRWQRICNDFHRAHPRTARRCIESDTLLANDLQEGKSFSLYRCRNGLTDAASPIVIEGRHLANAFIGQFFLEEPDIETFRLQAREFGFDESAYLAALAEVPIVSRDILPATLSFLSSFAVMLGSLTLKHLRQKETEAELRKAQDELRRSHDELELRVRERTSSLSQALDRLERMNRELTDFAHVASHDLQEPLRKIQAFGDRLRSSCGDKLDDTEKHYLARMEAAAGRMQQLIRDLLHLSRIATGCEPLRMIDLNEIAQEVAQIFELQLRSSGGRLEIGDLPKLEADATQMKQLFQNLIGNALKFQPEGARPHVRVHCTSREEKECRICVEDNGIGFEDKYCDRIFAPFQRLHGSSEYEGTGMGLAICRKIAERHGGRIKAMGRPGGGSVFVVTLPLKQSHDAGAQVGTTPNGPG